MRLVKGIFTVFLCLAFCLDPVFGQTYKCDKNSNFEKCQKFTSDKFTSNGDFWAFLLGGAVLSGGGFLLASAALGDNVVSVSNPPRVPTQIYDTVAWTDPMALTAIFNDKNYNRNLDNYNEIRLMYSLARGYTGAGTGIAILDSGGIHSASVGFISRAIAPGADILQYKISGVGDNFLSYSQIGNVIASAKTEKIFNASWGIPATSSINASNIYSRAQIVSLTDANFINQISTAARERDAIFVWAAGNEGTTQSNALSAMPRVMPELVGHFVNVVAFDTATGHLAKFSNECGVTAAYCITAPGTDIQIIADNIPYIVKGTSFAAPLVSGAIAVIAEAFPYMNSTEITELLFATARDLGANGNDEVYGWGMLDLERATRPVGSELVPLDNGTVQPLGVARASGTLGRKLSTSNLKFSFLDGFGRAFSRPLNDHIAIIERGHGFAKLQERADLPAVEIFGGWISFGMVNDDMFSGTGFLATGQGNLAATAKFQNKFEINDLEFFQNAKLWVSNPQASDNSMITDFSKIYSASVGFGANWRDWSFGIAIPQTVIAGNVNMRISTGRAANRNIGFADYKIDLSESPSMEYTLGWKNLSATYIDNNEFRDEFIFIAKTKKVF